MITLKVKKLCPDAVLPSYAHEGDAGLDLYSVEHYSVGAGERVTVSTGISCEFSPGYVALVWPRSGLSAKKGIDVLAGVIDSHYRGEYKIVLLNTSGETFEIEKGDKIAQLLIQPIVRAEVLEVSELEETIRGEGGFGSTGR